jgi:hypothetical protein
MTASNNPSIDRCQYADLTPRDRTSALDLGHRVADCKLYHLGMEEGDPRPRRKAFSGKAFQAPVPRGAFPDRHMRKVRFGDLHVTSFYNLLFFLTVNEGNMSASAVINFPLEIGFLFQPTVTNTKEKVL